MAKVIVDELQSDRVVSRYIWWKVIVTGAIVGLGYIIATYLINQFVIDPLYCRTIVNATSCSNTLVISSGIAGILTGVIGLFILARTQSVRPLIVVVAATITLWGLSSWTSGLSAIESILWSVVLYILAYTLFSWISRYQKTLVVIIASIVVIILARLISTL